MDEIRQTVEQLRESVTSHLENTDTPVRISDVGAQVREQVVRLLKRKDLRIGFEVILNDLRNVFTGFETFDHDYQRQFLEDAMRLIEQAEVMIAADKIINSERLILPSPPTTTIDMVRGKVDKILQAARDQKDRLHKDQQMRRISRRHPRPFTKVAITDADVDIEVDETRVGLAFTDTKLVEPPRRQEPRNRGYRRPNEQQQNSGTPKTHNGGGGNGVVSVGGSANSGGNVGGGEPRPAGDRPPRRRNRRPRRK